MKFWIADKAGIDRTVFLFKCKSPSINSSPVTADAFLDIGFDGIMYALYIFSSEHAVI